MDLLSLPISKSTTLFIDSVSFSLPKIRDCSHVLTFSATPLLCFISLASTYVLTRLAVVHHAALNCVRRIFAIVVTSLIFQVPIGAIGILGILTSFTSFVFYTRFKLQRQNKPRPVSSLLPMSAV